MNTNTLVKILNIFFILTNIELTLFYKRLQILMIFYKDLKSLLNI